MYRRLVRQFANFFRSGTRQSSRIDVSELGNSGESHYIIRAAVFIAFALISFQIVTANPSSKLPFEPMAVIGIVDGAKEEADRLYKLFNEHAKRIVAADERKLNPSSIPGSYLAKMHSEAWKAARDANRLSWMGEPAGEDLRIRFEMIQYETNRLCQTHRKSPHPNTLAQDASKQLQDQRSKIDQIWKYIDSLESTDKLSGFQNQMESKGMELRQYLAYLTPAEQKRFWPPFESALRRVDMASLNALQEKYDRARRTAIANEMRLANDFKVESERVRTLITAKGTATLTPGVDGDAAEPFAYLANLWANASAGLNRAIALDWAFTNQSDVDRSSQGTRLCQLSRSEADRLANSQVAKTVFGHPIAPAPFF